MKVKRLNVPTNADKLVMCPIMEAEFEIKGEGLTRSATDADRDDAVDIGHRYEDSILADEQHSLLQRIKEPFSGLHATLYGRGAVVGAILARDGDFTAREAMED